MRLLPDFEFVWADGRVGPAPREGDAGNGGTKSLTGAQVALVVVCVLLAVAAGAFLYNISRSHKAVSKLRLENSYLRGLSFGRQHLPREAISELLNTPAQRVTSVSLLPARMCDGHGYVRHTERDRS